MQCPRCGSAADSGVAVCARCGQSLDDRTIGADDRTIGLDDRTIGVDDLTGALHYPSAAPASASDSLTVLAPPPGAPHSTGPSAGTGAPRSTGSGTARGTGSAAPRSSGSSPGIGVPRARTGALEVGESFGRYHVLRMLGMGGMGAVYQAWDGELEVAVAVKVIRPDVTDDPRSAAEIERRFKRELLLARQVTHPNVVRIHDLGEIDGVKYITMPYIEGTDLAHVLKDRPSLPVQEALPIARQVAEGLDAAHRAGVVHRDLKPANIMIDPDGRALIMDFGIARGGGKTDIGSSAPPAVAGAARAVEEATRLGAVVGTIEYMAPEQARGELVDHRADIYAFGLILYRLLGGRRVSAADSFADLTARMSAEPTPLRKIDAAIPETVERIVSRCLQPDRELRYQTTGELVEALRGIDDNGVPRPTGTHLLKTWRFRLTAAGVILAAVLVAGTGTWLLEQWRDPEPPPHRDPVAVLVADSINNTGEAVFDGFVEQALTLGVEGAPFISAYQRREALRVARLLKADKLDETAARLVAAREGIKIVLASTIEKRGNGYQLTVKGLDPTSDKVYATIEEKASNRDGVLAASGALAAKVRSGLGDTRAVDARETFSSSSMEAISAYIKAQELSSAGRDQQAIDHYKQATQLDPAFGRAWGGWAMSATRLGRRDEAEELWKKALAQTDRMTRRERFRLEGAYSMLVTRNYTKAIDTYTELVKEYPADGAGHNGLANGYFRRLEFQKALDEGRRVIEIYPGSPLYRTNYALYAMYAGDFDLAAKTAQDLANEEGKATYDTYLPLAISAIAQDRPDAAREAYERMAKVDANGASLSAVGLADLALAQGRNAEAIAILRQGIAEDRRTENLAGVATKQIALADALGTQGDTKGAVAAAQAALEIDRTETQAVPAAVWLIAAKRIDEAAKLGAELEARLEPQARAYGRIVAAQVALAQGKRAEALDALLEAQKLADLWLVRFYLGQVYLDARQYTEARSEFERCVQRAGEGYAAFLDDVPSARRVAALRYWIGRAREGEGGLPLARTDYEAFLKTRAPDATDVATKDARARLTSPTGRAR